MRGYEGSLGSNKNSYQEKKFIVNVAFIELPKLDETNSSRNSLSGKSQNSFGEKDQKAK